MRAYLLATGLLLVQGQTMFGDDWIDREHQKESKVDAEDRAQMNRAEQMQHDMDVHDRAVLGHDDTARH